MKVDIINSLKSITGKRILVVCTTDSMIWNFLIPHIEALQKKGNIVECACSNTGFYTNELRNKYRIAVHTIDFSRNPYNPKNIKRLLQLISLVKSNNYNTIHCHEPIGGIMGRIVGKLSSLKVYYTAHGFHFYKGAPLKNWIVYYLVEKFLSRFTGVLITINEEDFECAKNFRAKNVRYIPGIGIDLSKFNRADIDRVEERKKLRVESDEIVLLSVGEMIKRKNHQLVIKAIAKLNNRKLKYIICGDGELREYLEKLAENLHVKDQIRFLGFRKDIPNILRAVDVFIFPSFFEGLAIAGLEAMAAGIPVIGAKCRGISDYVIGGKTGVLCDPASVDSLVSALSNYLANPLLYKQYSENAKDYIKIFDISSSIQSMELIYEEFGL